MRVIDPTGQPLGVITAEEALRKPMPLFRQPNVSEHYAAPTN